MIIQKSCFKNRFSNFTILLIVFFLSNLVLINYKYTITKRKISYLTINGDNLKLYESNCLESMLNLNTNINNCTKIIIDNNQESLFNPNQLLLSEPSYDICSNKTILVAIVMTAPDFFSKRSLIRKTWGKMEKYSNISVVFLVGKSRQEYINEMVRQENLIYRDILQYDFLDSYYKRTAKVIMGFKWISQFCKFAKYLMKVDDDILVNTQQVLHFLKSLKVKRLKKTWFGRCYLNEPVNRNSSSKLFVSYFYYKKRNLPPFCAGSAYILTIDLVHLLYDKSLQKYPPFDLEDAYIGFILSNFNITYGIYGIEKKSIGENSLNYLFKKNIKKIRKKFFFIWSLDFNDFENTWKYLEYGKQFIKPKKEKN